MSWPKALYAHKNPQAEAVATIASGTSAFIHDHRRADARQPTETPRKQAISTMLVKNVRKITVLPNHRMHASSKKRMKKLIRNSSTHTRNALARGGWIIWISGVGDDMSVDE